MKEVRIKYSSRGEMKEKVVKIFFVSNKAIRLHDEITVQANHVVDLVNEINGYESKIAAMESLGEKEDAIRELKEKAKLATKKIREFSSESFYKERFNLVKMILEKNGVEDEQLLSFAFWDEDVEPIEMINFLKECMTKDQVKKKDQP